MFHQYFEKPRVLRGIESADFQSHLDSFAQELDVVGFAREHVRNQLRAAAHLCVCGQGDNGSPWRVSATISFRAFAFTYRSANAPDSNAAGLCLSWDGLSGLSNIYDGSVFCQP